MTLRYHFMLKKNLCSVNVSLARFFRLTFGPSVKANKDNHVGLVYAISDKNVRQSCSFWSGSRLQ